MSNTAPRERLPYRVNGCVQGLRTLTRETDSCLEEVIAGFADALQDDGVIDENESSGIFVQLTQAFRSNAQALGVLNLLDESGSEAAMREVERIEAKRKKRR